jgi:hypothetical protein
MVDWKRCQKMETKEYRDARGFPPFEKLPHTNLGHYTVQQNLYAHMLRKHYGIDCKTLSLLQLHPDLPTFVVWKLELLPAETAQVLQKRADAVKSGEVQGLLDVAVANKTTERQAAAEKHDLLVAQALRNRANRLVHKWKTVEKNDAPQKKAKKA